VLFCSKTAQYFKHVILQTGWSYDLRMWPTIITNEWCSSGLMWHTFLSLSPPPFFVFAIGLKHIVFSDQSTPDPRLPSQLLWPIPKYPAWWDCWEVAYPTPTHYPITSQEPLHSPNGLQSQLIDRLYVQSVRQTVDRRSPVFLSPSAFIARRSIALPRPHVAHNSLNGLRLKLQHSACSESLMTAINDKQIWLDRAVSNPAVTPPLLWPRLAFTSSLNMLK